MKYLIGVIWAQCPSTNRLLRLDLTCHFPILLAGGQWGQRKYAGSVTRKKVEGFATQTTNITAKGRRVGSTPADMANFFLVSSPLKYHNNLYFVLLETKVTLQNGSCR